MRKSTYNCYTMTHETPVGSDVKTSVPLLKHLIKNDSMHASLSFPTCQCGRGCFFLFLPDIIFGVWISTKPFLVRVSLKSWHTPDCRRNTAWLVVVFSGGYKNKHHQDGCSDSSTLLHNHDKCVKTRLPVSSRTSCLCEGCDNYLLATATCSNPGRAAET